MQYDYADSKTGANAKHFGRTLFIFGTWGKTDVLQDLDIMLKRDCGACGHRGAWEQANWLRENVDWSRVGFISGHSLGGAVALWLGLMTQKPVETYGAFQTFLWKPKTGPRTVNYVYGWDIVPRLFWLIRRNYGKAKKIKGKGFHPFTDHLRYPALKQFGIKGLKEEL